MIIWSLGWMKILLSKAQGIIKTYHEVFLFMKFLNTKLEIEIMKKNCYHLFYTVKNRDDEEIKDKQKENDYIKLKDFNKPNHNISIKPRETTLR